MKHYRVFWKEYHSDVVLAESPEKAQEMIAARKKPATFDGFAGDPIADNGESGKGEHTKVWGGLTR